MSPRAKGRPDAEKQSEAEVKLALERMQEALKARQDAGNPLTDPALVSNVCDIADVYLGTNRPAGCGFKLLDPTS